MSNKRTTNSFKSLEEKLSKGNFKGGREKDNIKWSCFGDLYYIGDTLSGARVFYRFYDRKLRLIILVGYLDKEKDVITEEQMGKYIVDNYERGLLDFSFNE